MNGFIPRVLGEINEKLIGPILKIEIEAVVFSMHLLKALGKDGMMTLFFQEYWDIIDSDMCKAVTLFFFFFFLKGIKCLRI